MFFLLVWHFLALHCSAPLYRLSRVWGLALAPGLGGSRLVWLCGLTGSVVSSGLGLGLLLLWLTDSQRHLLCVRTQNVSTVGWILFSALGAPIICSKSYRTRVHQKQHLIKSKAVTFFFFFKKSYPWDWRCATEYFHFNYLSVELLCTIEGNKLLFSRRAVLVHSNLFILPPSRNIGRVLSNYGAIIS